MMISWNEILLRLSLAALFGGVVGIERERKNWTAGLRTHMMVCVGSTLVMMVSAYGFGEVLGKNIVLDPSRMAAQVISGIGFIGAGTILFLRQEVIRGLTTAAGLWTVAGIGLATGGGMYFAAGATTIIVVIILFFLKPLEKKLFQRYKYQFLKVQGEDNNQLLPLINSVFEQQNIAISNVSVEKKEQESSVLVQFTNPNKEDVVLGIINNLNASPLIKKVSWNKAQ
jgi:putative Mg2+ transporter-C (MgtC) family protein